ncbi:Presequence translocated-associated motor subunit pam17 [Penicillium macrosclerotiorum]|uniref:Presequence translocated-associated motor subunit pam17 n=1 Tax=Penicillium macrosclerotiorum TaxID=303699 RepID=UPI002548FA07|nr:Presequence translocated-associated motor subunit pam17 [Penicillium macrosclerotiorum]KAJ5675408.1 Presequence translocated-associated motor subunit pam17 [Penicillium macrosclerotiorum]
MSVRSVFSGRVGSNAVGTLVRLSPFVQSGSTASQQLARLHSTSVRPTSCVAQTPAIRPHVREVPSSFTRQSGLRAQSTSAAAKDEVKLDWNSFFKLRASRRRYSLASSIASSLFTTTLGVQVLSSQDLESLGAQVMGLDPFVVLGMATAACGAVGWLAGPFVGNGVWGLVYRRYKPSVATKEKEFFDRIRRFRVDPSTNSIANPVPDYYGEKIGSVQGYRQWLKDQRAYNRKRRNFIV